jgi:sorbitol/mannitol transport system permease protein
MQPSNFLPQLLRTVGAWAVALLLFFPLGWLFLTAFKTELQAIHVPPLFIFEPTLGNFSAAAITCCMRATRSSPAWVRPSSAC